MNIIFEKVINKRVVVADVYNDKLVFIVIEKFSYSKKYDMIASCDLNKIDSLIKFIQMYDYFIFFQKYDFFSDLLTEVQFGFEKIILVDEICRQILKAPFDRTIEDVTCDLENTYNYIFSDVNNIKNDEKDVSVIQILKIFKYLKLNALCDFKLFESILEEKDNILRVISFNVFFSAPDLKKNETFRQVAHLKHINADILFLQECSEIIHTELIDYEYINTASHCGFTYLLIKKSLNPKIIDYVCQDGIILSWIDSDYGQFVLGSLHMIPYDDEEDIMYRIGQIDFFQDWITVNGLDKLPVVIGGDTNMTKKESIEIKRSNFFEEVTDYSYPNREIIYKKAREYAKKIKKNFKYDKYFIKNISVNKFQTINTYDSDHFMNYLSINVK